MMAPLKLMAFIAFGREQVLAVTTFHTFKERSELPGALRKFYSLFKLCLLNFLFLNQNQVQSSVLHVLNIKNNFNFHFNSVCWNFLLQGH